MVRKLLRDRFQIISPTLQFQFVLVVLLSYIAVTCSVNFNPPSLLDMNKLEAKLTFNDDFNTFSWYNDGGTWQTSYANGGRTNNDELEYYSDSSTSVGVNPFSARDGILYIEANPRTNLPVENGRQLRYTSGIIINQKRFSQMYGYFEIRTKWPYGKGFWPAFWLLPSDGSWPPEIDALEAFGAPSASKEGQNDQYHWAIHSKVSGSSPGNWWTTPNHQNLTVDFHKYGVLWDPTHITFYFDGEIVAQASTPSDLHIPMYLLANLAVGGSWPTNPDSSTHFPAYMQIDYIRAWALNSTLYN